MTWTRPEVISALALVISALGFAVSIYSLWRTSAAEKPIAWLEFRPTGMSDCWIADIHLRNRSSVNLRAHSVSVPIRSVPVSKKQDFLLGDHEAAMVDDGHGNRALSSDLAGIGRHLKLSFSTSPGNTIRPGEARVFPVLLFRGTLSAATAVTMRFCIQSMEAKPRFKTLTVTRAIPAGGLTIVLA